METWTVKKILDWGIDFFKKKEVPGARLSAELLLAAVLGLTRMELYLDHDRIIKPEELAAYKSHILKRLQHVPIQYILGKAYFRNISLYVDKNVLIPRPETELLVEKALEAAADVLDRGKNINILEIGTGSGAITLSLYTELIKRSPGYAGRIKITATDISGEAIEVARKNAEKILAVHHPEAIELIQCDIIPVESSEWFLKNKGKIDLVISNPPYISQSGFEELPREIKEYEPREALLAGETGLEVYNKILERIRDLISPGGFIIFETDPIVGEELASMVKENLKVESIYLHKDYNQKERILAARIL